MKSLLLGLGILGLNFSLSVAAEPVSYSSITFHSVDYMSSSEELIHFKDVIIQERLFNISVKTDRVAVYFKEDLVNYTTLNLIGVSDSLGSYRWLKADRVIVVVRNKADLAVWEKFLSDVTAKQELERKKLLEPKRVLPPKL